MFPVDKHETNGTEQGGRVTHSEPLRLSSADRTLHPVVLHRLDRRTPTPRRSAGMRATVSTLALSAAP